MTDVYVPGYAEPFTVPELRFEWAPADPEPDPAAFTMTPALAHASKLKIARAFNIRPHLLGVDMNCACHPAPFPAARDYRRRTKHRNRRRR